MPIPDLPPFFNMIYTKDNGELTPNAQLYNDLMYQVLNQLIVMINNGLQLPNKTTAEITAYLNDTTIPIGTIWYNTSLNKLQFKTGTGTFETVTST